MLSPVSTIFLLVAATTLAAAADLELPESAKAVADEFTERCLTEANVDREEFKESLFYDAKPNYGLRYFYVCLLKAYGLVDEDGKIILPPDFYNRKINQDCIDRIEEKDIGSKAYLARMCVWDNAVAEKEAAAVEAAVKEAVAKQSFVDKLREKLFINKLQELLKFWE